MKGKDLLSSADLSRDDVERLFRAAALMKAHPERFAGSLSGKSAALIFEKPSLRTRVTFEAGVFTMGGLPIYLPHEEHHLGEREAVRDVARNLERWVSLIVARVFSHQVLVEMADNARIPVINALSDAEHPCQALADLFTLYERRSDPASWTLAFVGDGNNVCVSLMLMAATWGAHFRCANPEGYRVPAAAEAEARRRAALSGGTVEVHVDPVKAVAGVAAVYTDVWASMGQEDEAAQRERIFAPYQLNAALLSHAGRGALAMHCLPAHRGMEITDEVMDGPTSVVYDQAENRLHVQKAAMHALVHGLSGVV
ncbi:ornithine carbamoyltransferase [bacterium]|nr:ornithine carbamoyltransferase [bacterium]